MPKPCALVIRPADRFSSLLRQNGYEVLNLELIRTEPLEDLRELDEKLAGLSGYDGLFFTSPIAAFIFAERAKRLAIGFCGKVYVLGERARKVLDEAGFNSVHRPAANTAEELVRSFDNIEFASGKYLFVRGDKSMQTIPRLLAGICEIDEVTVYRTVESLPDDDLVQDIKIRLRESQIDWVCFFSPSGVEGFLRHFASEIANARVAVIGETTASRAREAGMNVRFVSHRSHAEDFARGLIELRSS